MSVAGNISHVVKKRYVIVGGHLGDADLHIIGQMRDLDAPTFFAHHHGDDLVTPKSVVGKV